MAIKRKSGRIRLIVQILFFALVALIALSHSLEEAGINIPFFPSASLHAACPFGGVVSIYEFFVSGRYVKKVHESSFILMFIVMGLSVILGPVFCGWVCPMGSFQEWIGKIGKKISKSKYNRLIPAGVDKILRYLRYVVLLLVIITTARSSELLFSNFDPYYALFNFWTGEAALSALIILGLVIAASFFIERPFCKYFCPYGAFLGLFNLLRVFKIKRNPDTCIDCKACDRNCPMNIPLSSCSTSLDHQCITCLKCTSEQYCPKEDTMELTMGKMEVIK